MNSVRNPYNSATCNNLPPKLHQHCFAVMCRTWVPTSLECLSSRLHHFHFLHSICQHVPDISLLLQTGVSQPDLHTAQTTQTPSGTSLLHTSSIFHSHMKYAWMCAWHLPSLGLCSPQEGRLMCNWEVCWINQQFMRFLIEITVFENMDNTENTIIDCFHIVFCLLSAFIFVLSNSPSRFTNEIRVKIRKCFYIEEILHSDVNMK